MVFLSLLSILVSLFQIVGFIIHILCIVAFFIMTGGVLYFAWRQFISTFKGLDDETCGFFGMFTSGLLVYWSPGLFVAGGLFYLSASITAGGLFGMYVTQIIIATLIIICLAAIALAGVFSILRTGCRMVAAFFGIFSGDGCGGFFANLGTFLLHSIVFLPIAYIIFLLLAWLCPIAYTPIVE